MEFVGPNKEVDCTAFCCGCPNKLPELLEVPKEPKPVLEPNVFEAGEPNKLPPAVFPPEFWLPNNPPVLDAVVCWVPKRDVFDPEPKLPMT